MAATQIHVSAQSHGDRAGCPAHGRGSSARARCGARRRPVAALGLRAVSGRRPPNGVGGLSGGQQHRPVRARAARRRGAHPLAAGRPTHVDPSAQPRSRGHVPDSGRARDVVAHDATRPDLPRLLVMRARTEPRVTRLFRRGSFLNPGGHDLAPARDRPRATHLSISGPRLPPHRRAWPRSRRYPGVTDRRCPTLHPRCQSSG